MLFQNPAVTAFMAQQQLSVLLCHEDRRSCVASMATVEPL